MMADAKQIIELQQAGVQAWGSHLFEEIIAAFYQRILKDGDLVVDGGAHAGLHTIPLSNSVGRLGKVLAFEPIPHFVETLRGLLQEKDIDNVEIRQQALSLHTGTAVFNWIKNRQAESSLSSANINQQTDEVQSFQVDTVCLDDVFGTANISVQPLRFMKLDLEGAEFDALRGAKRTLTHFRPSVILEFGYHNAAKTGGYDQAEWDFFYDEIGYGLYDLIGRPILNSPWGKISGPIWYLIAVPRNSQDEFFIKEEMPAVIEREANKWSKALANIQWPSNSCWDSRFVQGTGKNQLE